jgi:hypothetical protein
VPTSILLVGALLGSMTPSTTVRRCSVGELRRSPGYAWRIERVGDIVDSADVVLHTRAVAADSRARAVTFRPIEWLRGEATAAPIVLPGSAVAVDDFNARPVPYQTVRSAGQRGDCFAQEYRPGADYLLLLRREAGGLTVQWWPLAPLNEQLRGARDPWLAWVRERLRGRAAPSSGQSGAPLSVRARRQGDGRRSPAP